MSYGFSCAFCRDHLETDFDDAARAEKVAQAAGWRIVLAHTDAWGGNAHVACPNCAEGALVVHSIGRTTPPSLDPDGKERGNAE